MKKGTLFLKIAIFSLGAPVLAICLFLLFKVFTDPINPQYGHILYPIVSGLLLSAIPFYIALYCSYKLLNYIDNEEAFSSLSVTALKKIKRCAMMICGLYVVILPFAYLLAKVDDAPGVIIISMVPIFASTVIALFAALLQKLLQTAIHYKIENDLTV